MQCTPVTVTSSLLGPHTSPAAYFETSIARLNLITTRLYGNRNNIK
jgi:hypothetical protein